MQKDIDIVAISQLNLELTDKEDEILLTSGKNTAFKILKIVLFQLGLQQGKVQYELEQRDKQMTKVLDAYRKEATDFMEQLKSWKDSSLFEM